LAKTNPDRVRQLAADLGDGTYVVNLHDAQGHSVFVRVDADLWTAGSGPNSTPTYARLGPQHCLWVALVEKAWAFYRNEVGAYASIHGGNDPTAVVASSTALGMTLAVDGTNGWIEGPEVEDGQLGVRFLHYPTPTAYLSAIQAALKGGLAVTLGAPSGFSDSTS